MNGLIRWACLSVGAIGAMQAQAATYTVSTAADSGVGSLRDAIEQVNSNCGGGPHNIEFSIGGVSAGPAVIQLSTALPSIDCSGTVIDGSTQPDTNTGSIIPADEVVGYSGSPFAVIERPDVAIVGGAGINTNHGSSANGFTINADNVTIRSLSVRGFDAAVEVLFPSLGAIIEDNYFGVLEDAATIEAGDPDSGAAQNWSPARNNNGILMSKIDATTGPDQLEATIRGNVIAWTHARGIYVDGAGGWKRGAAGNGQGISATITGNWIQHTGQQGPDPFPLPPSYPNGGADVGFERTSGGGIEIQDTFEPSFVITGNRILGQPGRAPETFSILATGSNGIEINNGKRGLSNEAKSGGTCTNCMIDGNTITDYLNGIIARAGTTVPLSDRDTLAGYTVLNNTLSGNTVGLASGGNGVTVQNNFATENFSVGLMITGGTTTVTRNVANANAVGILIGDPMLYFGSRTNAATGNTVAQNTVIANARDTGGIGNGGIGVVHESTRTIISRNSISQNAGLGIDLAPGNVFLTPSIVFGVTPNHDGDLDDFPNKSMNFPVFDPDSGVTIAGRQITFTGWARPGSIVEFFVTSPDATDPTGFGEGLRYVCSANAGQTLQAQPSNPNGPYAAGPFALPAGGSMPTGSEGQDSGAAYFTASCPVPTGLPANPSFSATATDTTQGVTSEFSYARAVEYTPPPPPPPAVAQPVPVNGWMALSGLAFFMSLTGSLVARKRRKA